MSLDWNDLKVVLAIGRAGSLTKAAELLGIDQSTVGRRLTAAEAALGVLLFIRSKTGFVPTEAGEEAIARAVEMEVRALQLVENLAAPAREHGGMVRLVGNAWVLARLGAAAMPGLLAAHPNLQIHAVAVPRPTALLRGDATVSLWFESTPYEGEFAVKLGDVPYAVYARSEMDPETLDWITFTDDEHTQNVPKAWLGRLRMDGRTLRLTSTDFGVLAASLAAGLGKGLLPICLAAENPALVRLGTGEPDLSRTLYVHVHPDTVQTPRVQATMAWLRQCFPATFGATLEADHGSR